MMTKITDVEREMISDLDRSTYNRRLEPPHHNYVSDLDVKSLVVHRRVDSYRQSPNDDDQLYSLPVMSCSSLLSGDERDLTRDKSRLLMQVPGADNDGSSVSQAAYGFSTSSESDRVVPFSAGLDRLHYQQYHPRYLYRHIEAVGTGSASFHPQLDLVDNKSAVISSIHGDGHAFFGNRLSTTLPASASVTSPLSMFQTPILRHVHRPLIDSDKDLSTAMSGGYKASTSGPLEVALRQQRDNSPRTGLDESPSRMTSHENGHLLPNTSIHTQLQQHHQQHQYEQQSVSNMITSTAQFGYGLLSGQPHQMMQQHLMMSQNHIPIELYGLDRIDHEGRL